MPPIFTPSGNKIEKAHEVAFNEEMAFLRKRLAEYTENTFIDQAAYAPVIDRGRRLIAAIEASYEEMMRVTFTPGLTHTEACRCWKCRCDKQIDFSDEGLG